MADKEEESHNEEVKKVTLKDHSPIELKQSTMTIVPFAKSSLKTRYKNSDQNARQSKQSK